MLELQKDLHNKTVKDKFGVYVEEDMRDSIIEYFHNKTVTIIVAELDNKVIACLAVMIIPQPFNYNSYVGYEISWNFKEGYKGLAQTMLDEACKLLKRKGVTKFVTHVPLEDKVTQRYFKIKGYKPVEASFYKEI